MLKQLSQAVLGLIFITCPVQLPASGLPDLGSPTGGYSLIQEKNLGQAFLRSLRGQSRQWEPPVIYDFVNEKLAEISQYTPRPLGQVSTVILDVPQLNAFAVPGNIIGVNAGLFLFARTEAEFVSVLAHETGHLAQRHFSRGVENSVRQARIQLAAILAAIAVAAADSEASVGILASSMAATTDQQLHFSRELETEADRIGAILLKDSGYNPEAMAGLMQTMMDQQTMYSRNALEYLQTHPLSQTRLADARRFSSQSHQSGTRDTPEYRLLQALVRSHFSDDGKHQAEIIRQLDPDTEKPEEIWLAGFWLFDHNKPEQAALWAERAAERFPQAYYTRLLQVKAAASRKQFKTALNLAGQLIRDYPERLAPLTARLEILRDSGSPEYISQLKTDTYQHPDRPGLWLQLMQAASAADQLLTATRARAEYLWLSGREREALTLLESTGRNPALTGTEKARLRDRLRSMRQQLGQYDLTS